MNKIWTTKGYDGFSGHVDQNATGFRHQRWVMEGSDPLTENKKIICLTGVYYGAWLSLPCIPRIAHRPETLCYTVE